jgi:hypothetical protein
MAQAENGLLAIWLRTLGEMSSQPKRTGRKENKCKVTTGSPKSSKS